MRITKRQLRRLIKESTDDLRIRSVARRAHRLLSEQDAQIDQDMSSDLNELVKAVKIVGERGEETAAKLREFAKMAHELAKDPVVKAAGVMFNSAGEIIRDAAGKSDSSVDLAEGFANLIMGGPVTFISRLADLSASGEPEAQEQVEEFTRLTDKQMVAEILASVAKKARSAGADQLSTSDPDEIVRMLKQVKK